jgi:uncharacterized protein
VHDSLSIPSRALAEARPINVYVPAAYRASRAARFPVLYMPDGGLDEDFPHVVRTVDSLIARGMIRPVIVVGIPNTERRRDLTGSAAFRRFIREELIPAVDARYRTTDERGIVGESLAGLFVVETFLAEPALFRHYIALDPSLWWNRGALVDSAAALVAALDSVPRTLFLANSDVEDIAAGTARLASLLRTAAPPMLGWTYEPHPELTHSTIFRGLGPKALAAALK